MQMMSSPVMLLGVVSETMSDSKQCTTCFFCLVCLVFLWSFNVNRSVLNFILTVIIRCFRLKRSIFFPINSIDLRRCC